MTIRLRSPTVNVLHGIPWQNVTSVGRLHSRVNPEDTFDRAVAALGDRYRRRLLVALLDENPQDDDDLQVEESVLGTEGGDDEASHVLNIELVHMHLPKLESLGYITWNQEAGDISKGPNWDEIEPLLRLLRDHADELPDDWL